MSIKIEGTVTVTISELDTLRQKITDLTTERNNLLEHVKQVKMCILVEEEYFSTRLVDDYQAYNDWGGPRRFSSIPQKHEAVKSKRIVKEDVFYIGLTDVQQEIRREEESKVQDKLYDLESKIKTLQNAEKDLRRLQEKTLQEMREKQTEEVDKLKKENKEKVDSLQKEIDTLNGVVADKTKDEKIRDLEEVIEKLKLKKSFWGFLIRQKL